MSNPPVSCVTLDPSRRSQAAGNQNQSCQGGGQSTLRALLVNLCVMPGTASTFHTAPLVRRHVQYPPHPCLHLMYMLPHQARRHAPPAACAHGLPSGGARTRAGPRLCGRPAAAAAPRLPRRLYLHPSGAGRQLPAVDTRPGAAHCGVRGRAAALPRRADRHRRHGPGRGREGSLQSGARLPRRRGPRRSQRACGAGIRVFRD